MENSISELIALAIFVVGYLVYTYIDKKYGGD